MTGGHGPLRWLFAWHLASSWSRLKHLLLRLLRTLVRLCQIVFLCCSAFVRLSEILEDIDKLHPLFFDISLVSVSDKVHVDLPIRQLACSFLFFSWVERLFFLEVVKVFIADLRCDRWLVRSHRFADVLPVKAIEKGMRFDLFDTILAQSVVSVGDESPQQIDRMRSQVGFGRNHKRLFPEQNLLTRRRRLVREERRVAYQHLKEDDAAAPPVYSLIVAGLSKNFRRDVVWCSHS